MGIHKNAPLTPLGRAELVRRVETDKQLVSVVANDLGVCERTVRKWVSRYKAEGLAGLEDRSSRPHRSPNRTPQPVEIRVAELRRQRWTAEQIAAGTGVSKATVSRILGRLGLNRLKALEPAEPVRRYERDHSGGSMASATASPATAHARATDADVAKGSAGNSSMSASTMLLASPSSRSCLTRKNKAPSLS
jgi:transposase-like protein